MKIRRIIAITALIAALGIASTPDCSAQELSKKEQRELKREQKEREKEAAQEELKSKITKLLTSKNYKIVADRMTSSFPGGNRELSGGFQLTVKRDKAESELPFLGKMNTAPIGSYQSPMRFEGDIKDYKVKVNKKKKNNSSAYITFEVKPDSGNNLYEINLDVRQSGSCTLTIHQKYGDSQTYYGYIDTI